MSHYLDDDEATAATLSPEGWLRTGDIGTLDERGLLRIVGRSKDMFIVGGFNVYPAEIEDMMRRHPQIRDVGRHRDPGAAPGRGRDGVHRSRAPAQK